jgi:hypothetical protein
MPDEKYDEKEQEKREEKSREEKSSEEKNWDEKYRRDPLGSIVWACILIWAGLVFLAYNLGLLDFRTIPGFPEGFNTAPWSLVLLGAGVIVLIEVAIRLLVPEYRRPILGSLIVAVILIGIGLGNLINWNITGALILIAVGLLVIFRGIFHERNE